VRVPDAALPAGRWLAVLIPVVDVVLVLTGVLDARTGVIVGVVLEVLLAVVVVAEARAFGRAYRRARADGAARSSAAARGFEAAWPPLVLTLARAEIGLVRAWWWVLRGRRDVRPEEPAIGYSDRFTVMLWAITCLGALELGVVHVLTARWPVVQWTLFAIGCYALLWILGFGFSLRQHPHVLRGEELMLRFGHFRTLAVPLDRLDAVRVEPATGHRSNLVLTDDVLVAAVMGDSNVELRFRPPVPVEVRGAVRELRRIAFYADDPRGAVRLLRATSPDVRT
jgi:hypothetical protein